MKREYMYEDILVSKQSNKPPHWFLTKYQDNGKVNAVLRKNDKKSLRDKRWSLMLPGGGLEVFGSRRDALRFFNENDWPVSEDDGAVL